MARVATDSESLNYESSETPPVARADEPAETDHSKPFRGILIGVAIVIPLWVAMGVIIYFVF